MRAEGAITGAMKGMTSAALRLLYDRKALPERCKQGSRGAAQGACKRNHEAGQICLIAFPTDVLLLQLPQPLQAPTFTA